MATELRKSNTARLERQTDWQRYHGLIQPREGHHTYWGPAQDVWPISAGVWGCSTAGHGGIWISPERVDELPTEVVDWIVQKRQACSYACGPTWFEEDCAWAIPFAFLPVQGLVDRVAHGAADELAKRLARAPEVLKAVYPELYAIWERRAGKPAEQVWRECPNGRRYTRSQIRGMVSCEGIPEHQLDAYLDAHARPDAGFLVIGRERGKRRFFEVVS